MNNLENLYRQVIIEHYKHPCNKDSRAANKRLFNPSCGDDVTMEARIETA